MAPKCCRECTRYSDPNQCTLKVGGCAAWLQWFRTEWRIIQKAAERLKADKKPEAKK